VNLYLLYFVICVLCFLYCFVYVYVCLLVLSVLPPSDNLIAVNNNNKVSVVRQSLDQLYKKFKTGYLLCTEFNVQHMQPVLNFM
jgi:hypothetical protein